ncbi:unnamed protein product [Knipowitschia caucasica]|uniref:EGF-like domain-containing protein n=1 Tax=Knipowitschia caucasica TaxID=637954 RepID=A0AAV2MP78_KNICA
MRIHGGCTFALVFCEALLWSLVLSRSSTPDVISAGEQRPRVAQRSLLSCDHYCLNNGQCVFLVELNVNHCKCELGFQGSRCEAPQLVMKPMKEEQVALIVVSVFLLSVGLGGALYFFCKWYRRKHLPKGRRYSAVESA